MTRYDTSRVDVAHRNLDSCRVKVEKLAAETADAVAAGNTVKAEKLEAQLLGAQLALHDADAELDAAETAPPVPFVTPTEHVTVQAGRASGEVTE